MASIGATAGSGGGGGPGVKRAAGHVPRPMYEPLNTSTPPNLELDAKLEAFMADNVPIMTSVDLRKREQVLGKLRAMFLQASSRVLVCRCISCRVVRIGYFDVAAGFVFT